MSVAVVVTVRNEADTIEELVGALAKQTRQPDEIIVVDGGSIDDTVAILQAHTDRMPFLQLYDLPGSNISQGRNHGIAASTSSLIAVTDGGCIPELDWLAEVIAPLEQRPDIGLVGGGVVPEAKNHLQACIGHCSLAFRIRLGDVALFPTARCLAFRRAVWERVGGFPEELDYGEDASFLVSAVSEGAYLCVNQRAVVRWRPRHTYSEVVRQFFNYARGLAEDGLSGRFHTRTLLQFAGGLICVLWGIWTWHWLPWSILSGLALGYLWRKAGQGCFEPSGWQTVYRVPLVLLAIHTGTMAGIIVGNWRRLAGTDR